MWPAVPEEFVRGALTSGPAWWAGLPGGAAEVANAHLRHWQTWWSLALAAHGRAAGHAVAPVIEPAPGDRRFHGAAWRERPVFDLLKQAYLAQSQWLGDLVEAVDVDAAARRRLRFYMRQAIDAASPANFALCNPEVLERWAESPREAIESGLAQWLADLQRGRVSITDEQAFEVGVDVAASPGAVVFENPLFQLIQYAPLTARVGKRPLVLVPPCINKFYILDMQPTNSLVRFLVEQGHSVFVVSWRNPDESLRQVRWDDYVEHGAIQAVEAARAICAADQVNLLGWCVGGTIVASALAVLRARNENPVASLTLLTALLDFEDPGDLGVFIDEVGVAARELTLGRGGVYPGRELAFVFQTLRANDLIWPYVIDNYLKGKRPPAFDLLYWNADSTSLPGPMYAGYLRNMYLDNALREPGRLTMCGVPVDLGRIDVPAYIFAAQEDHIVPWTSAWRSLQLLGGPSQFVLGASGHIAGVINPASKNRRCHWTDGPAACDAKRWLAGATRRPGSWWTHWNEWLVPHRGPEVAARRRLGHRRYPPIEPAPGRYVKQRSA